MKNKPYYPWFLDLQPTGNHYLQFFCVLVIDWKYEYTCLYQFLLPVPSVSWYLLFFVLNLNLSWMSFNSNTHYSVSCLHSIFVWIYIVYIVPVDGQLVTSKQWYEYSWACCCDILEQKCIFAHLCEHSFIINTCKWNLSQSKCAFIVVIVSDGLSEMLNHTIMRHYISIVAGYIY